MTRDDLIVWAQANGVPTDAYALDGGHPSEAYVLDQRGPVWFVYYSERGLEQGLQSFGTESAALVALRDRLEQTANTPRCSAGGG